MPRRRLRRAPDPATPAPNLGADGPVDETPEQQLQRWFATQARPAVLPATDVDLESTSPLAVARAAIGDAPPAQGGTADLAPPDPIVLLRATLTDPDPTPDTTDDEPAAADDAGESVDIEAFEGIEGIQGLAVVPDADDVDDGEAIEGLAVTADPEEPADAEEPADVDDVAETEAAADGEAADDVDGVDGVEPTEDTNPPTLAPGALDVQERMVPADPVDAPEAAAAAGPEPAAEDDAAPEIRFTPLDDPNWTAHLLPSVAAPIAEQVAEQVADDDGEAPVDAPADGATEPELDAGLGVAPDIADEVAVPAAPFAELTDAAADEPVELVLPTSLVAPRESSHHPHPPAAHAAASVAPAMKAPGPHAAPRPDPDAVEFRSSEAPRYVLGVAFVVAATGSVLAIFGAVDAGTRSAVLFSAFVVAAALGLWWALVSWSPTIVSVSDGTLEVARGASTSRFDLRDPDTTVEVGGNPRSPSWRTVVTNRSGRRLVLNRRQVRPARFAEAVERQRDAVGRD